MVLEMQLVMQVANGSGANSIYDGVDGCCSFKGGTGVVLIIK